MFCLLDGNAIYGEKIQKICYWNCAQVLLLPTVTHRLYLFCTLLVPLPLQWIWYLSHNSCIFSLVPFWPLFGTLGKWRTFFNFNILSWRWGKTKRYVHVPFGYLYMNMPFFVPLREILCTYMIVYLFVDLFGTYSFYSVGV